MRVTIVSVLGVVATGLTCQSMTNYTVKSMAESGAQSARVGGQIYILHENPQNGDYAVYRVFGKVNTQGMEGLSESTKRVEIVKVENDDISIRETVTVDKMTLGGKLQDFPKTETINEIVTDRRGIAKSFVMTMPQYNVRTAMTLAKPGEQGYMELTGIDATLPVNLPVGKYDLKVNTGGYKTDVSSTVGGVAGAEMNVRVTVFNYYDRSVKFGSVIQHIVSDAAGSVGLTKNAGFIVKLLSYSKFTLDPSLIIRGAAKDLSQFVVNEVMDGKKPDLDTFVKQMGDDYRMASKVTSGSLLVLTEQGNKPLK